MDIQELQYQINIGLGAFCGFLFILVIYLMAKLSGIKKRLSTFLPENNNINLEEMLVEYINKVNLVLETEDSILKKIETNNNNTMETLDLNSKDLNHKLDSAIYNITHKVDTLDKDINYKVDTLNQEINHKTDSINHTINNKIDNINEETLNSLQNTNHRIDLTNIKMKNSVQKYALVRYNPFDDVGGDFCYSIAFLDAYNSGFVLTSIYSREGGYAYAKEIARGTSSQKLSPEEEDCLGQAMAIEVEKV